RAAARRLRRRPPRPRRPPGPAPPGRRPAPAPAATRRSARRATTRASGLFDSVPCPRLLASSAASRAGRRVAPEHDPPAAVPFQPLLGQPVHHFILPREPSRPAPQPHLPQEPPAPSVRCALHPARFPRAAIEPPAGRARRDHQLLRGPPLQFLG